METSHEGRTRWALLLLRLLFGFVFVMHGAQKLLGAFGGSGVLGFANVLHTLGFAPSVFWAWVVTVVEFFGGLCVFFGFLTRPAAALITIDMLVAMARVNVSRGFFWNKGGVEIPLILAVLGIALALTGAGPASVDRSLGREGRAT
jgi:putative oxidoreductase